MAKGKHAAALFEVINSDKKYDRAKTGAMMKTPSWWQSKPTAVAPTKTVRVGADKTTSPAPAPVEPVISADPMKPTADRLRDGMNVDPERQQIAFKLSYTTAIVAGFALLVAIVMAYLIGQKLHAGPQQAVASAPTSVIKSGAVLEGVLDVGPVVSKPVSGVIPAVKVPEKSRVQPAPHALVEQAPPARVIDDARRIVGLNYIIVQSYPEKAQADEARDALLKSGVEATAEKTPPTFGRKDWFSVIGTKGFDRIKSNEFDAYVKQIEAAGAKFASDRSFKAFKPQAFKWK